MILISTLKIILVFSRCEFFVGKDIRQQLISQGFVLGPLLMGRIRLLHLHLGDGVSIKVQTYANRGGGEAVSVRTFTHKFLNLVPSQ